MSRLKLLHSLLGPFVWGLDAFSRSVMETWCHLGDLAYRPKSK